MPNRSLRIAAAVLGSVVVLAATPAAARTVVQFARNAGHVDGFRAVPFVTCPNPNPGNPHPLCPARKDVLVATDGQGYLPNDIIRRATDSAELGGKTPDRFAQNCADGSITGFAQVPGDAPSRWTKVHGYGHSLLVGGPFPGLFLCTRFVPRARQPSPGVYLLNLNESCGEPSQPPAGPVAAVVTVASREELVATYTTVCGAHGERMERVAVRAPDGTPTSAGFTIAELEPVTILAP
jgi:hypothetical protein